MMSLDVKHLKKNKVEKKNKIVTYLLYLNYSKYL